MSVAYALGGWVAFTGAMWWLASKGRLEWLGRTSQLNLGSWLAVIAAVGLIGYSMGKSLGEESAYRKGFSSAQAQCVTNGQAACRDALPTR